MIEVNRWRAPGIFWADPSTLEPWTTLAERYARRPGLRRYTDLIASIVASGVAGRVGGFASQHVLHVLLLDGDGPRYPALVVEFGRDTVRVRHVATDGPDEQADRPESEAVALFWRFMDAKFDLRPR